MPLSPDLAQLLALVTSGGDPRLDQALLKLGLQLIVSRETAVPSPFGLLHPSEVLAILHPEEDPHRAPPRHASTDPGPTDDELVDKLQSRGLKAYIEGM